MELEEIAKNIRKKIFLMSYRAGSGHIAPSFSCVEILVALYFKILNIDKNNLNDENRDRFILSKGHASSALYSILAKKDIIEEKLLDTFCQKDGIWELILKPTQFQVLRFQQVRWGTVCHLAQVSHLPEK